MTARYQEYIVNFMPAKVSVTKSAMQCGWEKQTLWKSQSWLEKNGIAQGHFSFASGGQSLLHQCFAGWL